MRFHAGRRHAPGLLLFAGTLAFALLGERLRRSQAAGVAAAIAGVVLVSLQT